MEFQAWPKIPRLKNEKIVVTEKLDGTNACIAFSDDMEVYICQSRSRIVKPGDDNYGFALWCSQNIEDLRKLGPGYHFGEWWGAGIQRRYGLAEKRFSLFNTARWNPDNPNKPDCCHVVPVLYEGPNNAEIIDALEKKLSTSGSIAAPGFMDPEGFVVYNCLSRVMYKVPFGK